ncbi:MAG TPA: hypothetical protein VK975_06110, partial [Acidimicrobiales bacterium]|nr:hypothetical protein [Acidimicrobiales bacterium]
PLGYIAPASGTEARLARLLAEAGEAPLDRQVDVGGHEWVGRVDFADPALKILVEVDSALHHSSRLDRAADRRRDGALGDAEWQWVVRISEDQVWRRPREAVALVRQARAAARAAASSSRSGSHAPAYDPDLKAAGQEPLPGRTR